MDIINDPEIDIVSVCTPNSEHAAVSIAALKAGKHVICEKPIASTTEDAKAMAEAAAEAAKKGIVSMNGYQYRRVPAIDEAKKIIESGRLGELTNIRTQYLQSWSADPSSPLSWRFEKATAGSGTLTFEIHGTLGSLYFNYERRDELQVCFASDPDDRRGFRTIYTGPNHPYGNGLWPIPALGIGYTETKIVECYDFFNAIANDTQASPNFEDGYEIELISDAILKSAQTHTWVDVH